MALPDFPDYHKWGFSLAALNNDVYVTGGQGSRLGASSPAAYPLLDLNAGGSAVRANSAPHPGPRGIPDSLVETLPDLSGTSKQRDLKPTGPPEAAGRHSVFCLPWPLRGACCYSSSSPGGQGVPRRNCVTWGRGFTLLFYVLEAGGPHKIWVRKKLPLTEV